MFKKSIITATIMTSIAFGAHAQNYATVEDVATVQDQTTSLQTSINTLNADVDRRLGRQGTAIGANTASISDHTRRLDAQNIELHRQRTQINTVEHSARVSEERINTLHALRHTNEARITALESSTVTGTQGAAGRDGTNGRDGVDGARGATGATGAQGARGATGAAGRDGVDGRDGRDATLSLKTMNDINRGIAGTAALGFANQGGAGLGLGIASHNGRIAFGTSYVHDLDSKTSVSFGATTAGTFGAGVKYKF